MKKIKFALLPAFVVAIVGAFAAQGSSKGNLAPFYVKTSSNPECTLTNCSPQPLGPICSGTFYNTKTQAGECTDLNTATFRLKP